MPKLTKQVVDATDAKDKPAILWDDDLKGFFLRVMPSGTKTYGADIVLGVMGIMKFPAHSSWKYLCKMKPPEPALNIATSLSRTFSKPSAS